MSVNSGRYWASDGRGGSQRAGPKLSSSSKSSHYSDVFVDPSSPHQRSFPGRPYPSLSKVFTAPGSMRYTNTIRYGTHRSMPDHKHHPFHNGDTTHMIANGHATTGKRLYAPNTLKSSAHRSMPSRSHFKRSVLQTKEEAVTFFDIEMDKSPFYQYRPGEEISGSVHMDVKNNVEIRYVELVIQGQGTITILKARQGLPSTAKETYLRKQTFLIGTANAAWSSMLTPGHYMSKFRFRLPKDLPSSVCHDDLSSGFKMDINYSIKARICDDLGNASGRSNASTTSQLVRVLLSKKQPFRIQRNFDINLVPSAASPVTHTEEVYLSCAGSNLVMTTLHLERAVFLAGDDIKLQLAASLPHSQRIKAISCKLQQHLKLDRHHDLTTFTLSNIERADPQSTSQTPGEASFDVTIPTQTNLVTSFLNGCSMVRLTYTLAIELRFAPAGGTLSFTIPLGIGPCAEPIYAEKISSRKAVPIFNRPTRFPCFSPAQAKGPLQVDRSSRSSQSINVMTKYSNNFWARCFLCCFGSSDVD